MTARALTILDPDAVAALEERLAAAEAVIAEARTACELLDDIGEDKPRVRLRAIVLKNLLDEYDALDAPEAGGGE